MFSGPPIILQRVIPHYRRPFFEAVNAKYGWRVVTSEVPPGNTFLNLCDPSELPFADTIPMSFGRRFGGQWCSVDIEGLLKRYKPSAIVSEFSMRMSSSYSLAIARKFKRTPPVAFWTHGWSMERPFGKPIDNLSHYGRIPLMRMVDQIMTYTEEGRDWLSRYIDNDRLLALGNTIDINKIQEVSDLSTAKKLGNPAILSVGRLTKDKGFERLVRVFKELKDLYSDASLTIIGDGPELGKIKEIAGDLLGRGVYLTGAIYDEEELAPYFLGSDIYVLPGAAGLSVNHALAYGLPVAAFARSNLGPFHHPEVEYIIPGVTGWLTEDYSDGGLLDCIKVALSSGGAINKNKVLDYAISNLTIERMVENFGILHSRMMSSHDRI